MSSSRSITPQVLDPFFPEEFFKGFVAYMDELVAVVHEMIGAGRGTELIDSRCNRQAVHNDPFHVAVHERLVPLASELAGAVVKKSYAFAAMYGDRGICPRHVDRPQCKYAINLCVAQREPWGLFVDDVEYRLHPNQALFYSGTRSPHHRERIQPGNFCNLVFFFFVDEDFEGSLDGLS